MAMNPRQAAYNAATKTKPNPKPTVPPDYDVIIPGYNDRATVNRLNKLAAAAAAAKKKAKKK